MLNKIRCIVIFLFCVISLAACQNCDIIMDDPIMTTTEPWEESTPWILEPILSPYKSPRQKDGSPRGYFYINIPDDVSTDVPIARGQAVNVALIHFTNPYVKPIFSLVDNIVEFYVIPSFIDYLDITRQQYMSHNISLRCNDGSFNSFEFHIGISDSNIRFPFSSPQMLSISLSQSWPIEIPINLNTPLFVRDEDFRLRNARVTLTPNSDIVSARLTSLFPINVDALEIPFDYKAELFIKADVGPGNYLVELVASDGLHSSVSVLNLTVTEATCVGKPKEPVFGIRRNMKSLTYYNATIKSIPKVGDILPGVQIQAFDPDELCNVFIQVMNSEYLNINSRGEVVFVKSLTGDELKNSGPTWITEIQATGEKSGKSQNVPLIISVDLQ